MEKQYDATPKKLIDLRKKGQFARAQLCNRALPLGAALFCFIMVANARGSSVAFWAASCFRGKNIPADLILLDVTLALVLPICTAVVVGIIFEIYQSGWLLMREREGGLFEKCNPIQGVQGIWKKFMGLPFGMSLVALYLGLLGSWGVQVVSSEFLLLNESIHSRLARLSGAVSIVLLFSVGLALVVGIIDFIYERIQFLKKNRMSMKELKDEYKKEEGDPYVKGQRKALYEEILYSNLAQRVKKSKFIVVERNHK
jgi:flagellar biosynthesis protein FlhB